MATFLKLKSKQLRDRLDAVYYRPVFLQNEERLRSSTIGTAKLSSLVERGRRAIYFSTNTLERGEAPESWVPFLTSDDLGDDGFFIDLEARRYVAPEFAAQYPQGRLRANELLIKVKGPNQTTAYIEREPERPVLVSGTIWGGLVRCDKVDPHFLVTALSSPYAAIARSRLRTNTNVEFLAAEDLLNLQLPFPNHRSAQAYIGDKVRQAERLRVWAREAESDIQSYFSSFTAQLLPFQRSWRTSAAVMDSYRINAPHYDPVVLDMLKRTAAQVELTELGEIIGERGISGGATPRGAIYVESGVFFVRVQNVKPLRLDLSDAVFIDDVADEELARSRCQTGEVIFTITGYPGTAALVLEEDLPLNINQHSVRFDVATAWRPEYVVAALNSGFVKRQVDRLAIGGTRDALDYNSVRSLAIPVLNEEAIVQIARLVRFSNAAVRNSARLTAAAKLLVEALIEGKLSEAELKEAQESLERGEREADRAILARLTRKGIDAAGEPPLFSDLDALYAALDQTADAATQNQY